MNSKSSGGGIALASTIFAAPRAFWVLVSLSWAAMAWSITQNHDLDSGGNGHAAEKPHER
jgi:hypothetical protein